MFLVRAAVAFIALVFMAIGFIMRELARLGQR